MNNDQNDEGGPPKPPPPPQLSPDGKFWWNGEEWTPVQIPAAGRGLNLNPQIRLSRSGLTNVAVVVLLAAIVLFGIGMYHAEQDRHRQKAQVACLGYALEHGLDSNTYCAGK